MAHRIGAPAALLVHLRGQRRHGRIQPPLAVRGTHQLGAVPGRLGRHLGMGHQHQLRQSQQHKNQHRQAQLKPPLAAPAQPLQVA